MEAPGIKPGTPQRLSERRKRARSLGGEAEVNLPSGQKLVTATWKESSLWYLTRPMRQDERPESYTFKEESGYGVVEGTVRINERR